MVRAAASGGLSVTRHTHRFLADPSRVIARPLVLYSERQNRNVVERVLGLAEPEVQEILQEVMARFARRHHNFISILDRHATQAGSYLEDMSALSQARRLLLGAYLTQEYAIEAAALFNPSIVPHPDQQGVERGELRVLLRLRATGEGHISSVEFREGTLSASAEPRWEPVSRYATLPELRQSQPPLMMFDPASSVSERVLFPITPDERNGIEDVRLVRFAEEDGTATYFGAYTAYDGVMIRPKLFETRDFITFQAHPLLGRAIQNKGFALFPRRVKGHYLMLSRQDNEHNYIMRSTDLHRWDEASLLREPRDPWEIIQIGNCGSPLETEVGWLALTHGVGPMRQYTIGVDLLDLEEPTRVIARLPYPLLAPDESEREGYVPNVVYSCGALIHRGHLILPYAMSDSASGLATVPLDDLLGALISVDG
jgi:predicted GH43/DUF377 family glycosyl hydrolase